MLDDITIDDPSVNTPIYDPGAMPVGQTTDPNAGNYDGGFSTGSGGSGVSGWGAQLAAMLGGGKGSTGGSVLSGLVSTAGGIYGLTQAQQLSSMAQAAFGQQNPFAQYRPQYGAALANLMANPNSITSDPGYQFGITQGEQGVDRALGAKGLSISANELLGIQSYDQQYAGNYLNQQEQLLANLAGANITPNAQAALSGQAAASGIASGAINAIGYGLTQFGGASAGTPAAGAAKPGGFSAASGEAAQLGGIAQGGLTVASGINKLAGNAPISGLSTVSGALGGLLDVTGIVGGITKGGPTGYLTAAADAAKLANYAYTTYEGGSAAATAASASGALGGAGTYIQEAGSIAGYIAAPLSLYNAIEGYKSGQTGGDTLRGAEAGAAIGSIVPGIGTLIGGAVGGVVGAISSLFGAGGTDTTKNSWNALVSGNYANTANDPKLLVSAVGGLMRSPDTNFSGAVDFQGDGNKFTTAIAGQVSDALSSGKISPNASATDIFNQVVQPWLSNLPGGWNSNLSDPNQVKDRAAETQLVTDVISNYIQGKPITYGETIGQAPEHSYTPFSQVKPGTSSTPGITPVTPSNVTSIIPYLGGGGGSKTTSPFTPSNNLARMAQGK